MSARLIAINMKAHPAADIHKMDSAANTSVTGVGNGENGRTACALQTFVYRPAPEMEHMATTGLPRVAQPSHHHSASIHAEIDGTLLDACRESSRPGRANDKERVGRGEGFGRPAYERAEAGQECRFDGIF